METARFPVLITVGEDGALRSRTMDPLPLGDDMVVWFGTRRQTRKVREIRRHPQVLVHYTAPDGAGAVSLAGTARLVDDAAEKARRWKDEWRRFYADREADYILIAVTPSRLEIVNYRPGVVGDSATWRAPAVEFVRGVATVSRHY
jgi:general stress protein 26